MNLKEAVEKFAADVEDLSNLEVTTYTGALEDAIDADSGTIDWRRFKPTSGKLILVAATVIKPDLDTVNFRAQRAGIEDLDALLKLHQAAVESAQNGRLALFKMLEGMIKLV